MALTDAQKLARAQAQIERLKAQLAAAGPDPEQARKLAESEVKTATLTGERDAARTDLTRVTEELRQCGDARRRLEESLRETKDQLHEIALNARDFQRELETVSRERDSANRRITDLETENRRLNGVLAEKNLRIAELETKVSQEGIKFKLW